MAIMERRLSLPTRIKSLEAGLWQRHDGRIVRVREMHDAHLINALLKALADREPMAITKPLTAEVVRRNLYETAMRVAEERS